MTNYTGRPRPIADAIRSGAWRTWLGVAVTAGVSFGLLNAEQVTVVNNLVATMATLVTAATALLSQLHILNHAEPLVTPLADPRNDLGQQLVPAPPPITPDVHTP